MPVDPLPQLPKGPTLDRVMAEMLRRFLDQLDESQLKRVMDAIGMPRQHRPTKYHTAAERTDALMDWIENVPGGIEAMSQLVARLQEEWRTQETTALRPYLSRLVEAFSMLPLQGVNEAETLHIELEKVYVALKAEPRTDFDREQEAKLHQMEADEAAKADGLDIILSEQLERYEAENIRRTYLPAREEARMAAVTEVRTLADAFRRHRRLIILGGPGSGKTTLGRWLVLQMARTLLNYDGKPVPVEVSSAQVDPDPGALKDPVSLGPARVPIFLRVAFYSGELVKRDSAVALPLINYLGRDPDSEQLGDYTPDARNALFRSLIENKRAIIILDGLDELPEANRGTVVHEIEKFIGTHILSDDQADARSPWESGGNQVVITSRYVGYQPAPVRAGCAHYGIQAMRRPAVEWFVRSWTAAVKAKLKGQTVPSPDDLIAEIYDEARPAVQELATNPLLVTILATVYYKDKNLPDQRAELYHRVVENTLNIWLDRQECKDQGLTREELLAALQPLAAWMQVNASRNGFVSGDQIREIVEAPLARMRSMETDDLRFESILQVLLTTIEKQVGLLAQQSKGNYAFFHRTFQEFLAARHLLASRDKASAEIRGRLDDPLWREPLQLALGFAMLDRVGWLPNERSKLLLDVLEADGPDALIPRASLLLVAALPDMANTPESVVKKAVERLLASYAISLEQAHAGALQRQIEQALEQLRQGRQKETAAKTMAALIGSQGGTRDLAPATAALLRRIGWFTPDLVKALLVAVERDRPEGDWPIRRALLTALGYRPANIPWLQPLPLIIVDRSYRDHLPMRILLEQKSDLAAFVRKDSDWLWLLVALYGGISHIQLPDRIARRQQQMLRRMENLAVADPIDEAERVVVDRCISGTSIQFSPHDIICDLEDKKLGQEIQGHLMKRKRASDLKKTFDLHWADGSHEALVGLAALGENVVPMLGEALESDAHKPSALAALQRFDWLRRSLEEPLLRSAEVLRQTVPDDIPELHQLDLLYIALDSQLGAGSPPAPVAAGIPAFRLIAAQTPAAEAALDAEYWAYLFSGLADDQHTGSAAAVHAIDHLMRVPMDRLLDTWMLVPSASNHGALRRLFWPLRLLAPRADDEADKYLQLLDTLEAAPMPLLSLAGHLLRRFQPLLERHPDLRCETLILMWARGDALWSGYGGPLGTHAEQVMSTFGKAKDQDLDLSGSSARVAALITPEEWQKFVTAMQVPDALWTAENQWPILISYFEAIAAVIGDPYLRFRAWWRYLHSINPLTSLAVELPMLPDMAGPIGADPMHIGSLPQGLRAVVGRAKRTLSLGEIRDPERLLLAYERIVMTDPVTASYLGERMQAAAASIQDPENQVRAHCRLALFFPEKRKELLQKAAEMLNTIDPLRRVKTVLEARHVWAGDAEVLEILDQVAASCTDPWLRDKAMGQSSRLIQTYRGHYTIRPLAWRLPGEDGRPGPSHRNSTTTGALAWGLAYLSATACEVQRLRTTTGEGNWARLNDNSPLSVDRSTAGMEGGVPVTAREITILDRTIQAGRTTELEDVWPLLERPVPEALATIRRWSGRPDMAGRWSALVQAEAGQFNEEIVTSVLALLADSTDRLRCRAALALHGTTPYAGNKNRRWSVERIGAKAFEAVAQEACKPECPPPILTTLYWINHDSHYDDPAALKRWLEEAGDPQAPASWIIKNMESVRADLVVLLLDALTSGTPELQRLVLTGLARLAHVSTVLRDKTDRVSAAVAAVPAQVRHEVCSIRTGPISVLEIARKAIARKAIPRDDRRLLRLARQLLQDEQVWLDDACLATPLTVLDRLRRVGQGMYIYLNSYWDNTNIYVANISASDLERVLDFLLSWLAAEYASPGPIRILHDLLTATEAVARRALPAFARLADPPERWVDILTEFTQTELHWTSRMAAVRLLGRLRRVDERVVDALCSAMNDVSFVQESAYEAAAEFRKVEGDILPRLLELLKRPNAAVAAATARLLVGLTRSENNPTDRREILKGLENALSGPFKTRPVYLLEDTRYTMQIHFIDRLDRLLYQAISQIDGW